MKVLLGMSGGIDSSVAAMLLMEQGYEVIGATLRLWSETDDFNSTEIPEYVSEAKQLASKLGIKHFVIDAKQHFYNEVISYFKSEYINGRTPNPCAKCNVVLKWHKLNELAEKEQCNFIATGHYVNKTEYNGRYYITKGLDPDKEQSFFLWGLSQQILKKALFPLGGMEKEQVRQYAESKGFYKLKQKKESTGACFLNDNNYQAFLQRQFIDKNILPGEGNFINEEGEVLGSHNGFPFYTVGQRRGLGLVPKEPYYVTQILPESNTIILGNRNALYQKTMLVQSYNVINKNDFQGEVITRIRYRKQAALSKVSFLNESLLKVEFIEPEWSIAPGQTAAFYINDRLLGGGYIKE